MGIGIKKGPTCRFLLREVLVRLGSVAYAEQWDILSYSQEIDLVLEGLTTSAGGGPHALTPRALSSSTEVWQLVEC